MTARECQKRFREKRIANGMCVTCPSLLSKKSTSSRCDKCRKKAAEKYRRLRNKRIASGICGQCSEPATAGKYCLQHWFANTSSTHLGARFKWTILKDLWDKQEGLCAYTGKKLVPCENASLDHKTPKSRGGSNNKRNLQWVTKIVNRAKTDMTHKEFLTLCSSIALRCA